MTEFSTPESSHRRSSQKSHVNHHVVSQNHANNHVVDHNHVTNHVHKVTKVRAPVDVDGTQVLISVGRAMLARLFFIVHSMITIWQTVHIANKEGVWGFALISLLIVFEGAYTIIMRAGDERKWFCSSVLLYVVATAPPIWILETKMCEWRREVATQGYSNVAHIYISKMTLCLNMARSLAQHLHTASHKPSTDDELRLQLLEQLLLVVLIIGRWMLPKGDISREQLSQILLAYLAISSDIVEFFDVFKEKPVYSNTSVQKIVLSAWTLSLLQFPFVLTVSRARKMRVAITKTYEELMTASRPKEFWDLLRDVDLWAIMLANSLQDIPFLLVRLHLMLYHGLITYTMIFFTCKNALIIVLQTYRAFILLNDRYIRPKPPALDIIDAQQNEAHYHHRKERKSRRSRGHKREKSDEREHLFQSKSPARTPEKKHSRERLRDKNRNNRHMDILEESIA